ncbi:MAG: hypothetical protein SGPRY_011751, partial [Prymnesium sp.]
WRLLASSFLLAAGGSALPWEQGRSLKRKESTCAEAQEGEEAVFDCGGEFISAIVFASYGAYWAVAAVVAGESCSLSRCMTQ